MSAYQRGELSIEAYLVRILAGVVRQAGGELRVKGEAVDTVGEPTALLKEWDQKTQEIVLRTGVGSFTEVFKVIPERQPTREILAIPKPVRETPRTPTSFDPLEKLFKDGGENGDSEFLPKTSTLDEERAVKLERDQRIRRAAALIREELDRKKRERSPQGSTT